MSSIAFRTALASVPSSLSSPGAGAVGRRAPSGGVRVACAARSAKKKTPPRKSPSNCWRSMRGCFDGHKRYHTASETFHYAFDHLTPQVLADGFTVWYMRDSPPALTSCEAFGRDEHDVLVCE